VRGPDVRVRVVGAGAGPVTGRLDAAMPVMRAPGAGTGVSMLTERLNQTERQHGIQCTERATVELILIAPTGRRVLASGESRAGQVS